MSDLNPNAGYGATVGERLRQAREARRLTLDDVAKETRIPIRHLRNIEDSNWGDLPAVTYTIGFARAYAIAVGLDGPAIGQEVRDEIGGTSRAPTVSPEIYAPPDPARVPSRSLAWAAGILLVVLIAAWLLVIRPYLTGPDEETAGSPAPTAQESPQSAQPTAPQPSAPAPVAGQPVTLVATGDVWMGIRDRATNRQLFNTTLRAGERFQIPSDATDPVLVVTINPQSIRVMIGDQDRGPLAPRQTRIRNQSLRAADLATLLGQQPG